MVTWLSALVGLYALISIGGGIEGYVAKGSMASLGAGAGLGIVLLVGIFVAKDRPSIGYGITAVGSLLLVGGMLPRFLKSHGIWPAGVIAFGGIIVLIAHIAAHFMKKA